MTSSDRPWGGLAVGLHDSAAALVWPDGRVTAVAEERLTGEKRCGGWPERAVRSVSDRASQEAEWGVAWRPWSGLVRRFLGGVPHLGAPRARMLATQLAAPARLRRPVRYLPHHLCHAASALWTSPWEETAVLVVDAAGEGWSTWCGVGEGWSLRRLAATPYPHSLGMLYAGVTEHLGFRADRDEGIVMGLAAHSAPDRALEATVAGLVWADGLEVRLDLDLFAHHHRHRPILGRRAWASLGPPRRLGEPLGGRHLALARALQRRTEEVLVELARGLRDATGLRRLCLAGGVALNGPAVERVLERSGFDEVFVPAAPHDVGTAIGAALLLAAREGGVDRDRLRREVVFPGPSATRDSVRAVLGSLRLEWTEPEDATGEVASLLARGLVVGRFRGAAELGPRALGHRSLLADPRQRRLRSRLNRIKGREWFRPVAPVMTLEAAARYLRTPQPAPFMERAIRVYPRAWGDIPAVVHADATARAQTVDGVTQPELHALLVAFGRVTGVEVLANTSFNGPGRPMVTTAEEAVLTAVERGIDVLDLEGCLVKIPQG